MSKPFSRVLRGDEAPACCIRCGRDTDLIDLGADPIMGFGVVYVCMLCISELTDGLDLVPRSDIAAATAVLEQQVAILKNGRSVAPTPTLPTVPIPELSDVLPRLSAFLDSVGSIPGVTVAGGRVDVEGVPRSGSALGGGERRDDLGDLGNGAGSAGAVDSLTREGAGRDGGAAEGFDLLTLRADED